MRLPRSLLAGAVLAGAALAYYVQQRHIDTGEGYLDIVRQLPADLPRLARDVRRKATLALEDGVSAARRREAEITKQLEAAHVPESARSHV